MAEVRRMVYWFDKASDSFVGKAELHDITLLELQRMFNVPADNPMYDCWPIYAEHLGALMPHLAVPVDVDRYAYFVEADAIG